MIDSGFPSMKKAQIVSAVIIGSLLLSACGARTDSNGSVDAGNGNDTQPIFNANGELLGVDGVELPPVLGEASPESALKLRVISDVNSIETGGTDVATITVLVTDENNNAVGEKSIQFSSTSGVLQNISPSTDENGEASATLRLPQDYQNQDIVVTVSNGSYESSIKITASGSTMEAVGPDNLIAGDSADLVVRLTAGNGEPIANEVVSVTSAVGNPIAPAELITDVDGRVDFTVGSDNSSDILRITALNESVSATHSFDVVQDLLTFLDIGEQSELPVGRENVVRVNWTSEQQAVVGQALSFSITAGSVVAPSTVVTDLDGNAEVRVISNSSGSAKINVEATQGGSPKTNIDVEFVATVPQTVTVDASASRVSIGETSTITALVKDRLGNPVKNSEVVFAGEDLKGGQLNPASAITNSAGIASVTFSAGDSATEQDEISIEASVKSTNISDDMNLTVFKRALNVTLGSTNLITTRPLGTQYGMPMIVQVADGSGTPLEDATVRVSVRPIKFGKGVMELYDAENRNLSQALIENLDFVPTHWDKSPDAIECPAEDRDGDRILDTLGSLSEDTNDNGSLDPQDPASLVAVDGPYATLSGGTLLTDQNGSGFFELLYPASNARWSYVEITVRAEALGAEATDSFRTGLGLPADEINDELQAPASVYSPYGTDDRSESVVLGEIDGVQQIVARGCTTNF